MRGQAAVDQHIRYATSSDGVRIAYAVMGKGTPVVRASHWLTHLEYELNSPVWRHLILGMASRHTLVRYDGRGTGLSQARRRFARSMGRRPRIHRRLPFARAFRPAGRVTGRRNLDKVRRASSRARVAFDPPFRGALPGTTTFKERAQRRIAALERNWLLKAVAILAALAGAMISLLQLLRLLRQ